MSCIPVETAYSNVKQELLDNFHTENTIFRASCLSKKHAMTHRQMSDALLQLERENWLVKQGTVKFTQRLLSASDAEDLFAMRCHLEPLLFSHALPHLQQDNIDTAQDEIKKLALIDSAVSVEFLDTHWKFLHSLYAPSRRPVMLVTVEELHRKSERFISHYLTEPKNLKDYVARLARLLTCIQDSTPDRARQVLRGHLAETAEAVVSLLHLQLKF